MFQFVHIFHICAGCNWFCTGNTSFALEPEIESWKFFLPFFFVSLGVDSAEVRHKPYMIFFSHKSNQEGLDHLLFVLFSLLRHNPSTSFIIFSLCFLCTTVESIRASVSCTLSTFSPVPYEDIFTYIQVDTYYIFWILHIVILLHYKENKMTGRSCNIHLFFFIRWSIVNHCNFFFVFLSS